MKLFTLTFWKNALESALVAAGAAFSASLAATGGAVNAHNLQTAGIAAGVGALYAFIKQFGAVQASTPPSGALAEPHAE